MEVTSAARWYYVAHLFATMYMPVCLVKYWGKRDVFPIRAWDPAVIVTGGSAAVVGCWMSIASELAPDSDVFITGTPLALVSSIAIDAYIWQLVVLHAKFTATRSQVDIVREQHRRLTSLMTRSSHDKLDLVPSFDVIAFDRRIVSRWAASLFIIANLLVVVIPLVFIRQRSVGAVTALDCHRMRWIMECRGLAYVKITEMGLSLTLFLALLFRTPLLCSAPSSSQRCLRLTPSSTGDSACGPRWPSSATISCSGAAGRHLGSVPRRPAQLHRIPPAPAVRH